MSLISKKLFKNSDVNSQELLETYSSLLTALPGLAIVTNIAGQVFELLGNKNTHPNLAKTDKKIESFSDFLSPSETTNLVYWLNKSLEKQSTQSFDFKLEASLASPSIHLECHISPLKLTSKEDLLVCFINDISTKKTQEKSLQFLASHDGLTGVASQSELIGCLKRENQLCIEHGLYSTLVYIDLDEFKKVNEDFGREVGDEVLCQVAARLESQTRQNDFVARVKEDEFALLFPTIGKNIADAIDESANIATKIKQTLSAPILINGNVIQITASIGISVLPQQDKSAEEILRNAGTGMDQRKDYGKGYLTTFG